MPKQIRLSIKCYRLALSTFLLVLPAVLLTGCCLIDPNSTQCVNPAITEIDQTIAALDRNSADWQNLVQHLYDQLNVTEKNIAQDVLTIEQRGILGASVQARCGADFVGNRVKEDLQRLRDRLLHKTPSPVIPQVCAVHFTPEQAGNEIDMAHIPDDVFWDGYNLDTNPGFQVVFEYSGGEMVLPAYLVNATSPYVVSVITAPSAGLNFCNQDGRRLVLRWGGTDHYSVGFIPIACPLPQPPPTPLPGRYLSGTPVTDTAYGKFIGGTGVDHVYGGPCDYGYQRTNHQVIPQATQGPATATDNGWVDDNPNNCQISVHYSIGASSPNPNPNYITVKVFISEQGVQLPPPPTLPCPCK